MNKFIKSIFWSLIVTVLGIIPAAAQTTYTITNTNAITIRDFATANPYPSSINVTTIPSGQVVSKVTVTLKNFSHTYPEDAGFLIVSPTGQKVRLFTDCLGDGGGNGLSNKTFTFDDFANIALPDNPTSDTPSGTYKTKRGTSDGASAEHPANFAAPAPQTPYSEQLSAFNGINPQGVWKIFGDDDSEGDSGIVGGGWEINITVQPVTAAQAVVSGQIVNSTGTGIAGVLVKLTHADTGEILATATTSSLGYYTMSEVAVGQNYVISGTKKSYTFNSQFVSLLSDATVNLMGETQ